MTFADLKDGLKRLDDEIALACGQRLFDDITIDEPAGAQDELYFSRLTNWSYVVLNEAGALPLKYLQSLLRVSDPDRMIVVASTRQTVLNLRTVRAHNLPPATAGNQHKLRQASIWIAQNGGDPTDWSKCCEALLSEMIELLRELHLAWTRATDQVEDRAQAVSALLAIVHQTWEPHVFDEIVSNSARELGIQGLDVVAYRSDKLESWRQLAGYFVDREHAKRGVAVAIRNQLADQFT